MSEPTAEQQLQFLTNLQRLLAEGQFVATYKYALLLALADIAIESGDDSGEPLTISTKLIAEKFIQYYWRQVVPYVPKTDPTVGQVVRQNTGKQAAITNKATATNEDNVSSMIFISSTRVLVLMRPECLTLASENYRHVLDIFVHSEELPARCFLRRVDS